MKWFKHLSNARNDERLSRLEDKAGLEGYGFYFKILEIVAEVIDESNRCEVTYSLSRWGRQTNITSKKWLYLSSCCSDVGLMLVQRCSDDITVKITNLLKFRDNHTRNLQVTSKQDIDKYKEDKSKSKNKNNMSSCELDEGRNDVKTGITENVKTDIQDCSFSAHTDEVAPKEVKRNNGTNGSQKNDIQVVFDYWRKVMTHDKAKLDVKRTKEISTALKIGYSVEDLQAAILGCSLTPHNMGSNDSGQRYDGLSIILKNADQIDRFIKNSTNPPQQKSPNAIGAHYGGNGKSKYPTMDEIDTWGDYEPHKSEIESLKTVNGERVYE